MFGKDHNSGEHGTLLRPLLPSGWLGICHRNGKTTQRLQGQRKMVRHASVSNSWELGSQGTCSFQKSNSKICSLAHFP